MEKTALIDGDFIPFYVCHNKKDTEPKTLEQVLKDCDNLIYGILLSTRANSYIGFLGKKGIRTFRHKLNENYKANRRGELPPFFAECREHLINAWGFVYAEEELEVDDCVNILYNKDRNKYFIVSPDKDILQLEGRHYNPRKGVWVDNTLMHEEAAFNFWKDMLTGQPADNISGVRGIGEKTASVILNSVPSEDCVSILQIEALYASRVLTEYILKKGVTEGIQDFYKNYKCLKILSTYPINFPEPILFDLDKFIEDQIKNG